MILRHPNYYVLLHCRAILHTNCFAVSHCLDWTVERCLIRSMSVIGSWISREKVTRTFHPPLFYPLLRKCKIWPQFSIPVTFEMLYFQNGANFSKYKICVVSASVLPKFGVVSSTKLWEQNGTKLPFPSHQKTAGKICWITSN